MTDVEKLLQEGFTWHQRGELAKALEIYQQVCAQAPEVHHARYLWGALLYQQGEGEAAAEQMALALRAEPGQPEYRKALALALARAERMGEAEQVLREGLENGWCAGAEPAVHLLLGQVLRRQGRGEEALAVMAGLDGGQPEVALERGRCFALAGRKEEAAAAYAEGLARRPEAAALLAASRRLLLQMERLAEAERQLAAAVGKLPVGQKSLAKLADGLQLGRDFAGAAELYGRLLANEEAQGRPAPPEVWFARGCARQEMGEHSGAAEDFAEVLTRRPEWDEARHNRGCALFQVGETEEAAAEFERCLESGRAEGQKSLANLATILPGVPGADNAMLLAVRRAAAKKLLGEGERTEQRGAAGDAGAGPIRVGYLSSFFSSDNWMKPVWGVVNQHERTKVAVHLFSDVPREEIRHGYVEQAGDRFTCTKGMTNEALAQKIREAKIQVLVDLNGYSDLARLPLLAMPALYEGEEAPRLVGWFNHFATTGLKGFAAVVGDAAVVPAAEERFYTEPVVRVEGSYLAFSVDYPVPEVRPRAAEGPMRFGSLCSLHKVNPEVVASWSEILKACPESTLELKSPVLGSAAERESLRRRFARHGIAGERLRLSGRAPHYAFLETYGEIDLALDTFPYNGGTTTTEALWQGVPVLTFWGDRWASRTSASLLRAAGMEEWVAEDRQEYVAKAVAWSRRREELAAMRMTMRERLRQSAVCDVAGLARQMETIYGKLLERKSA